MKLIIFLMGITITGIAGETLSVDKLLNFDCPSLQGLYEMELSATTDVDRLQKFKSILDNATTLNDLYADYVAKFKQNTDSTINLQSSGEVASRQLIFKEKLLEIFAHNLNARNGAVPFELGVNEFSDMTYAEFSARHLGYIEDNSTSLQGIPPSQPKRGLSAASKIDFRALGHVTSVKNQGQCGSCVPFAVAACLESSHSLWHNKQHLDLSEQEVVDCTRGKGNHGCNGGNFLTAFDYLKNNGLGSEAQYPYEARDGACRSGGNARIAKAKGWWSVLPHGDENKLKEAVSSYGPIAVAIHVSSEFMKYKSGIFQGPCTGQRNHALLVVGYDSQQGIDYWIVKNSWGTGWGENGYVRIRRNFGNLCQIASDAVFINA